jgi:5,10-methylenetetrahydrofolate reductase
MVFGPCGGVRPTGQCELDDRACPFVDEPLVRWDGPSPAPAERPTSGDGLLVRMATRPVVVTDLRVRPLDPASVTEVATVLGNASDAVLVGDHQSRHDLPPVLMARLASDAGARPWVTLSCRDRNGVVLESELEGLALTGAVGVHCVTGDGRGPGARTNATQVFDLDSLRLVALARRVGLAASVAATPVAPPVELRPARVVEKERAGASVCFVNHAGGPAAVDRFVTAARAAGATLAFIPCVPVFTDEASAAILSAFPGVTVDEHLVDRVLQAPDPVEEGVAAAVEQALAMAAIEGVGGVNLSGAATSGPETESAAIMAAVGSRLLDRWGGVR